MNNMAEDDLKYPEELIAGKFEELPTSEMKVGVGSMPGDEFKEADKDVLISGRGLVP